MLITWKKCPIGLVCEHFDCRPQICNDYAKPIELPYQVWSSDGIYPQGTLVCQLPELRDDWDWEEPEYVSINRSHYNVYTARIRAEMLAVGWGGNCELPYFYNLENCCLFVDTDESLAHGFARAIPFDLHFRPSAQDMEWDLQSDGFCDQLLKWDDYYEFDM